MPAAKGNKFAAKPKEQHTKYKTVGIALLPEWWQRFTKLIEQKKLSKSKLIQQWIERDEKENS